MNTFCKNIGKTLVVTCLSLGLSGVAMASTPLQQHAEYAAIDSTMQTMMQAFEQGDAAKAHRVILPDTVVVGYSIKQQKVVNVSGAEWSKGFQVSPDEDQRHRQYQILDITDTGAVVKVMLDYPQWLGVDYLAMTKINGQWRVVSKSWSGTRKDAK